MNQLKGMGRFVYLFNSHENDRDLCHMELRALFDSAMIGRKMKKWPDTKHLVSDLLIEPGRSPFISGRLDVLSVGMNLEAIAAAAAELHVQSQTFKVRYLTGGVYRSYDERREIERVIGGQIRGKANMRKPDIIFGVIGDEGLWHLGIWNEAKTDWHVHKHKPQNYSTGLSVHVARSLVNIAVPQTEGIRAIDPCCGMGNVLIEALSMGIDIIGRDLNPLAVRGARANLEHFGYSADRVTLGDLNDVSAKYDAAIIDLPYNLCSHLTLEQRRQMLGSIKRFCRRAVIVSTELIDDELVDEGFSIVDYGVARKGSFVRHIWLCVT